MKLNTLKNKFLREAIEVEARWAITLQSIKETTILLESQRLLSTYPHDKSQ